MKYYAIFVCSVFHVPYGCIFFFADVYLKQNQDILVQTNNGSPEASNHSNTSIQFIQSGTEFSIESLGSNQQSHLCTSLQLVSTSCWFICIAGLKVLSFSLYIMAVLLVCSFCASRSVMVIYAVCVLCAAVRLFRQVLLYSLQYFHWIGSFIVCLQAGGWEY